MPFLTQGKTNWKFLLIIIVLAVIVGGAVLWCARTSEQPYPLLETRQPKRIAEDETADPVPSEVEEWQTYRNEKYGFEFEYPKEWQDVEEREEWGFSVSFSKEAPKWTSFVIGVNMVADFPSFPAQCSSQEEIEIAGVKTRKTNYWSYASPPLELTPEQCEEDPSLTNIYSSIKIENDPYEFAFFCKKEGWEGAEGREKCNDLYDQALSTFRFLE